MHRIAILASTDKRINDLFNWSHIRSWSPIGLSSASVLYLSCDVFRGWLHAADCLQILMTKYMHITLTVRGF